MGFGLGLGLEQMVLGREFTFYAAMLTSTRFHLWFHTFQPVQITASSNLRKTLQS
jgi:hypothetical protein